MGAKAVVRLALTGHASPPRRERSSTASATAGRCCSRAPGTPRASWPAGPPGRPAGCVDLGVAAGRPGRRRAWPTAPRSGWPTRRSGGRARSRRPSLFLLTEDELRHVVARLRCGRGRHHAGVPRQGPGLPACPVVVVGGDGATASWEELEAGDELAARATATAERPGRAALHRRHHRPLQGRGPHPRRARRRRRARPRSAATARAATRSCCRLPLAHAYGLLVTVAGLHAQRAGHVLPDAVVRPGGWVALVEEHRIQTSALVPSMIQMLLAQPLEEHDLTCLERVGSGAAPLSRRRRGGVRAADPELRDPRGLRLHGVQCADQHPARRTSGGSGSVGKPVPGVEVRIELPDGTEAATGEDGEICVGGATLMQGYWNSPEATAFAVRDGLAAHRRRRPPRRGRLALRRRPHQGPHHPRRLQRLPARRRGRAAHPPRGRGCRRRRQAGPQAGRGGRGLRAAARRPSRRRSSSPTPRSAWVPTSTPARCASSTPIPLTSVMKTDRKALRRCWSRPRDSPIGGCRRARGADGRRPGRSTRVASWQLPWSLASSLRQRRSCTTAPRDARGRPSSSPVGDRWGRRRSVRCARCWRRASGRTCSWGARSGR